MWNKVDNIFKPCGMCIMATVDPDMTSPKN